MKRASDICYARVSTYGQTLDAQLEQLRGAGCTKIYREKVTGAHSDRRELVKMRKGLAAGDVVTVAREHYGSGPQHRAADGEPHWTCRTALPVNSGERFRKGG